MILEENDDNEFSKIIDGLELDDCRDEVVWTLDKVQGLTDWDLLDLWHGTEESLLESNELLTPRTEWAQDTHNLRFLLRQEVNRRKLL